MKRFNRWILLVLCMVFVICPEIRAAAQRGTQTIYTQSTEQANAQTTTQNVKQTNSQPPTQSTEKTSDQTTTQISTEQERTTQTVSLKRPKVSGAYKKKKIRLCWKKEKGAEVYSIYRKKSGDKGKYVKIGQTEKLHYSDSDITKGKYYDYRVTAGVYITDEATSQTVIQESKKSSGCKVFADGVDPAQKMVAITFDDGPGRYTKEIVNCLKDNNARATFFVVGCNVDSYKDAVQSAYSIGCEIANHSYDHSYLTKLSAKEVAQQMSRTDEKVKKITGKKTTLMRVPYGAVSGTVKNNVGKPIILWSIDTLDWKTRNKDKTISAVMNNVKDGDIVLMHDIHEPTKEAALALIPKLRKEGYQLVTVSELAKYRGHKLQKGSIYNSLRKK